MGRAETIPERRRKLLGIEDGEPRNAPTAADEAFVARIVDKVLSRQGDIRREFQAQLLQAVPGALSTVIEMASGERGRSTDQLAAAIRVIEWARCAGPSAITTPGAGALGGLAGVNLSELPLDQLESVLAGTLETVRTLRAIESTAQVIDAPSDDVPTSGTQPVDGEPEQAPAQGALPLPGASAGAAPAPPPRK